jgi:hypothetical protein
MKGFISIFFLIIFIPNLIGGTLPQFTFVEKYSIKNIEKYALKLHEIIEITKNNLPTNSPDEKKWIQSELDRHVKTKNSKIYWDLIEKKSYKLYSIHKTLNALMHYLEMVQSSNKESTKVLYLGKFSLELDDENFWNSLYKYVKNGYLPKDVLMNNYISSGELFYLNNGKIVSKAINKNILLKYLEKSL